MSTNGSVYWGTEAARGPPDKFGGRVELTAPWQLLSDRGGALQDRPKSEWPPVAPNLNHNENFQLDNDLENMHIDGYFLIKLRYTEAVYYLYNVSRKPPLHYGHLIIFVFDSMQYHQIHKYRASGTTMHGDFLNV